MSSTALRTLESGDPGVYVLGWPLPGAREDAKKKFSEAMVVPVMGRKDGVMLAVPEGFFTQETLDRGHAATEDGVAGPSTALTVPAVEEMEDGEEKEVVDLQIPVLLMDFSLEVERGMREFDPSDRRVHCFLQDAPEILPSSQSLLNAALQWTSTEEETRVHYYSAGEGEQGLEPEAAQKPAPPKPQRPKKVTNAVLADQVAGLAESIPAMMAQLDRTQSQQKQFEKALEESQKAPVPPYRQSFLPGNPPPKPPGMAQFAAMLGQAPRAKQSPFMTPPQKVRIPEDEPTAAPEEEGHVMPDQENHPALASAISQQTQAMTALVAHLVGQSDLSDLAAGSSSMALSSRGSSKREKLQSELANRSSSFLLQVAQLAAKRSKPSEPLPASLNEFHGKALFTKYLTRHGGYAGQRELGYVAWLLAHIADCLLAGDVKGAQEVAALSISAVDQACQDGNRWDVAFLIALLEEPPPGVFSSRGTNTNPRMKAFSPLVPQAWASTTLTFVKEMDLMASRRAEASGASSSTRSQNQEEVAAPKKRLRYPKKPKDGADK